MSHLIICLVIVIQYPVCLTRLCLIRVLGWILGNAIPVKPVCQITKKHLLYKFNTIKSARKNQTEYRVL